MTPNRWLLAAFVLLTAIATSTSAHVDRERHDYTVFESCLLGPEVGTNGCNLHDWDGDGDTDLGDYAGFQFCHSGDGVSPPDACLQSSGYQHDADFDGDVDLDDYLSFDACLNAPDPDATCLGLHDFDNLGVSDGLIGGLDDFAGFNLCFSGPDVIAPESCLRSTFEGSTPPPTGTFALHGRPVDVLADGKTLTFVRARYYDAENGRWLQRDPAGFADSGNLYESFHNNAARNVDPTGLDSVERNDPFLTYITDRFITDFARIISPGLVLIDRPEWPFAFLMRTQDAIDSFDTTLFESDFYSNFDILRKSASLAQSAGTKRQIVAIFDKNAANLGWVTPDEILGNETEGAQRFRRLANQGLSRQVGDVGQLTATAFTVTTGALAAPAGISAVAVDVAATGLDVASGQISLTGGTVVVTAVAAGSLFHFSFADDAVRAGRAANVADDLRFTQVTASPRFTSPKSLFNGKSIGTVTQSCQEAPKPSQSEAPETPPL